MTTEHYRCPHCGTVYDNELITRVHVTRADDDQHANRNGLMPECEIEVVDDDGTVIDHRTRQPDAIDLSTLTRDDFPDDMTSKRRDAVLVAAHHPDVTTRTELTELIEEELADTDREPPADWTVRRALDAFYHPHESSMPTDESFSEIPTLQQAVILANLTLPEASIAEVADRVGCAASYPPQVMERRQYLADAFTDRQAEGETLAAIVRDELSATQVAELVDSGYLDDIPIDVGSSEETHATPDREDEPSTTSERLDSDWGAPTDDHGVMTASPPLSSTSDEHDESEQTSRDAGQATTQPAGDEPSTEKTADTDGQTIEGVEAVTETTTETHTAAETLDATSDGGSASTAVGAETVEPGPSGAELPQSAGERDVVAGDAASGHPHLTLLHEVRQLKSNLRFFRQSLSPVDETPHEKSLVISLTERTEAQCDRIIQRTEEEMDVHRG